LLVLVFCAKTTVPVSSDRLMAAIMIFFIVVKSFFLVEALCASNQVSQTFDETVLNGTLISLSCFRRETQSRIGMRVRSGTYCTG
jgi:hypothetical protein